MVYIANNLYNLYFVGTLWNNCDANYPKFRG